MSIKASKKIPLKKLVATAIALLYLIIMLTPIYFAFITSIKTDEEVYSKEITWIPRKPTIKPYIDALFGSRSFIRYLTNTVIVALSTTVLCLLIASSSAYAISRFDFRGKRTSFLIILFSRLLPPVGLIIPWYILIAYFGLIDTLNALIITSLYINLPISVWLLKGFFDGVPREVIGSALVDGCSEFQAVRKIVLPLAMPGLGAVGVITFISAWGEFLFAVTLTNTIRSQTASVGMYEFITDTFIKWPQLCAGGIIASIPAIIFVAFFTKSLLRGWIGGLKG